MPRSVKCLVECTSYTIKVQQLQNNVVTETSQAQVRHKKPPIYFWPLQKCRVGKIRLGKKVGKDVGRDKKVWNKRCFCTDKNVRKNGREKARRIILTGFQTWLGVHFTITANRIWAICFPVHYRNHHSRKVALAINLCLVSCALTAVSPYVFLDMAYYRLPEFDNGCTVNPTAQWSYMIILQLIYYDVPILFPLAMYPLLCYKHFRRRQTGVGASHSQKGIVVNQYIDYRVVSCVNA